MIALITCAGPAVRWGDGVPKQLAVVDGEPILHRTVRKCLARKMTPTIVAVDPRLTLPHVASFEPDDRRHWVSTMLACKPIWGDETVVLLGDVWFSAEAMDQIAEDSGLRVYGRSRPSPLTGGPQEVFACRFSREHHERVEAALRASIVHADRWFAQRTDGYDATGKPIGSPWQFYRALVGADLETDTFDRDVWREAPEDFTDDFDSRARYERWLWAYERRWGA